MRQNIFFTKNLLKWNSQHNKRIMPWKGENDPYKIWLSEIILQQTRVEQGLAYYNRFLIKFPTIHHLAKAPEINVFKLWEGLGYYTRCKNIINTAKYISKELNGKFPNSYNDILKLKGIGPYTAAAISSFAFNLPHAVVDGNVFRVLARFFGIIIPVDSTEGKKTFTSLANDLLNKKKPAIYNQALMDFGAIICKPQLPLCTICPLHLKCVANLQGLINILPVKRKIIIKKVRWFYYIIPEYKGMVYIHKRTCKGIWENLYEFILYENNKELPAKVIPEIIKKFIAKTKFEIMDVSKKYKQQLSHQTIYGQFIRITIDDSITINGYELVDKKKMKKLPFPKLINTFLAETKLLC
jgi:A/G-specific adenine glycosylase